MSTHSIKVFKVDNVSKHPNADKLDVIKVDHYQVCAEKDKFKVGDLAVYIEPDYIVDPAVPEFSFLGEKPVRVRVKRLRGLMSQGFLIPAPPGTKEGDEVIELLKITRYDPDVHNNKIVTRGPQAKAPSGTYPVYDLESWYKYERKIFSKGEHVVVTEKIHGANARFKWQDGRVHLGSRTQWKMPNEDNVWSQAIKQNPWIEKICKKYEDFTFYGEVFGQVQDLRYGAKKGEVFFRIFDVYSNTEDRFLLPAECSLIHIEGVDSKDIFVPILYSGPYDLETVKKLADGPSFIPGADNIREGVVVKSAIRDYNEDNDRCILKIVSDAYYERQK